MKLNFQQISNTENIYFFDAIRIYNESFPVNERQPLATIIKRLKENKSELFVGILNEEVVCMALLWNFIDLEFVLLDYMAVDEKYRNNKYGGVFFSFLSDRILNYHKHMVIEVENYLFGNNIEQRKKRINFYLNNGAYILKDTPYVLPSLDNTLSTEMLLMIAPRFNEDYIDTAIVEKLIIKLYKELYGKTQNDILLSSILSKMPDHIQLTNIINI